MLRHLVILDVYAISNRSNSILEGSPLILLNASALSRTYFVKFQICHILRHENSKFNMLGHQASGYDIIGLIFTMKKVDAKGPNYSEFSGTNYLISKTD